MYSAQPKKLIIINILEILQKYSDENHRLSQKDIVDLLASKYNMKADRKSVKRNLMNLIEFGYNIEYSETVRMVPGKDGAMEESYLLSDFYLVREFTDGELRLLIDSLLFSRHLPYHQCEALIQKLENLSSNFFRSGVRHMNISAGMDSGNDQLFLNIETLDTAILQKKQVSFFCNDFGIEKKLHPHKNESGHPIRYVVNPYQISAVNGRYYLICSQEQHNDFSVFRLEYLTEMQLLESSAKPLSAVRCVVHNTEIPVEILENQQIYINGKMTATFRFDQSILNDVIDNFGSNATIVRDENGHLVVRVSADPLFIRRWAMQNAANAQLLSPVSLVDEIRQDLQTAMQNYRN